MSSVGVHTSIFLIRVLLVTVSVLIFALIVLILALREVGKVFGSVLEGLWRKR